jgi:hypothetical protein
MGRAADNLLKQNLSNLFLAKHSTFGLKSYPLRFTDRRKIHASKLSNSLFCLEGTQGRTQLCSFPFYEFATRPRKRA